MSVNAKITIAVSPVIFTDLAVAGFSSMDFEAVLNVLTDDIAALAAQGSLLSVSDVTQGNPLFRELMYSVSYSRAGDISSVARFALKVVFSYTETYAITIIVIALEASRRLANSSVKRQLRLP